MKPLACIIAILYCCQCLSQSTVSYYDFYWKPCEPESARYYSTVKKTDSGWLRMDYYIHAKTLQMEAYYEDAKCTVRTGPYNYFHANGRLLSSGRMIKNKQEGICVSYHSNGIISDSANYHNGEITDMRFTWHRNGYMADSIKRTSDSTAVRVGWFDDGAIAYAGFLLRDRHHKKWQYFHHNGNIAALVVYNNGTVVSKEYFNEDGSPQTDQAKANREVSFKKRPEDWRNYAERSLYWPPGLELTITGSVIVGVEFSINEDGKIEDAEVTVPFHPDFDRIALEMIQRSPAWNPAIEHNRKIKSRFRQPVTFTQTD